MAKQKSTKETAAKDTTVREAVGVFDKPDNLHAALDELQQNGFMQQELTVLSGDRTYSRVQDAEDDPAAPRSSFIPDEIVSEAAGVVLGIPVYVAVAITAGKVALSDQSMGETMLAVSAACVFSAIFGGFLALMVRKWRIRYIRANLEKGGLALWVHLRSPEHAARARKILAKHAARDVHLHEIPLYG